MSINKCQIATILLGALIPTVLIAGLFWPTTLGLSELWLDNQKAYVHGYLLPVCALYFGYLRLNSSPKLIIKPCWWLLPVFAASTLLLAAFQATSIDILSQSLLPLTIILGIGVVLGWSTFIQLLPALATILLGIPIWDALLPLLQHATATIVEFFLELSAIPALVQDTYIVLPSGTLQIAESCGGLRYLLSAITTIYLAILFLDIRSLKTSCYILIATIAVALLSNCVRVWVIVQIAFQSDMKSPLVNDHYTLGWWIFAAFLLPLLYFFVRRHPEMPKEDVQTTITIQKSAYTSAISTIVVILSIYLITNNLGKSFNYDPIKRFGLTEIGMSIDLSAPWHPAHLGADHQLTLSSTYNKTRIYTDIIIYESRNTSTELISFDNTLSHSKIDSILGSSVEQIGKNSINHYMIALNDDQKIIAYQWFYIGSSIFNSTKKAKLFEAFNMIFGDGISSSAVVYSLCDSNCEKATADTRAYAERVLSRFTVNGL